MDFIEEDFIPDEEVYEVAEDLTLIRIPNQSSSNSIGTGIRHTNHRSTHNKENVCNNVAEPDRFQTILANIGINDDVQLLSDFFEVVDKKENNYIVTKCLGCEKPYKANSNVPSNLVTHLKVSSFNFAFYRIFLKFSLVFS